MHKLVVGGFSFVYLFAKTKRFPGKRHNGNDVTRKAERFEA